MSIKLPFSVKFTVLMTILTRVHLTKRKYWWFMNWKSISISTFDKAAIFLTDHTQWRKARFFRREFSKSLLLIEIHTHSINNRQKKWSCLARYHCSFYRTDLVFAWLCFSLKWRLINERKWELWIKKNPRERDVVINCECFFFLEN